MIESRVLHSRKETEWTLYGGIHSFCDYKHLIKGLDEAQEDDVILLKINSEGGRIDVGTVIVHAIRNSLATVMAQVVAPSASMAAVIACACDSLHMYDHTYLMFHDYSGGYRGKGDEISQMLEADNKCIKGLFNSIVNPFLSKAEINRMWSGKDLYIYADDPDLYIRLKRHFLYVPKVHIPKELQKKG